jgi:hypothetical protein
MDYTRSLDELTWDRIHRYDVIVLMMSPDAWEVLGNQQPSLRARVDAFRSLIERFVDQGGGVLLFPAEKNWNNWSKQALADLTDPWGARLPLEVINETDPNRIAPMTHSSQSTRLAFTDRILPSPVTDGVRGLWFPYEQTPFGGMTGPIVVDPNWQVVAKASSSAKAVPLDTSRTATIPAGLLSRSEGETEPAFVAIRNLRAGRVALINQWPQFSIGAGTRWIFNREVLDRGVAGRTSDFGRLLENTLRWLGERSVHRDAGDRYQTAAERLQPPNQAEDVRRAFQESTRPYDVGELAVARGPANLKIYRGLIGAQTTYGAGTGTVEQYARAARESKLDFVVFLDAFNALTPSKLESLEADCKEFSTPELLLLPGFTIDSNIGDHLFFFSPHPTWPPHTVLLGPTGKRTIYLQQEDGKGGFTGYLTPYLNWVLDAYHGDRGQVGIYDFVDSPHGMRLHDARLYSMTGIRSYRSGKLREDILDEFLTTAQSTIAPAPAVVDEVRSPKDLLRAVARGHSLTYAQAESLDASSPRGVFRGALRWSHQYESLPVFASSGPSIAAWPAVHRAGTFGAEGFAPGRAWMSAPLSVVSEKGLKEIRIYDGRKLFRRIKLRGERSYQQTLVLDGAIQRDLVLVVEDRAGGVAVSAPLRCWTDGALAPSFCSDHVNDCRHHMLLAHGPYSLPMGAVPDLPIDIAGATWDGGPPASMPLVSETRIAPRLESDRGVTDAARADQIPLLDFSDEGSVGVSSERHELYDPRLANVVNPWNTFGPIGGGTPSLFDHVASYREVVTPSLGAPESEWAGQALRTGVSPSLFTSSLRFKRDLKVRSLRLASLRCEPSAILAIGKEDTVQTFELSRTSAHQARMESGDWFGVFGNGAFNAQLFFNRGAPLRIEIGPTLELHADLADPAIRAGQTYQLEIAALGFQLDIPISSPDGFRAYVDYLKEPNGLQILRGKRIASVGMLEASIERGALDLRVPRSHNVPGMTLPLRITGLNPRWSSGLLQKEGYSGDFYGPPRDRWRALAVDADGFSYVPLWVDLADNTVIVAGHPIIAAKGGEELFIQATNLGGAPPRWHVSVNNPTDREIRASLRSAMDLPGLSFEDREIIVRAGEYVVIQ